MAKKQIPTPLKSVKRATKHGLGRLFAPDKRDAMYPMSLMRLPRRLPAYKYWLPGAVLNQGNTPRCVSYAWKGWLMANPIRQGATLSEKALYDAAQKVDEWPGENYDGTSVRAGAKVLQAQEYMTSYLWAMDLDQLKAWVLVKSPVVVGTNWYSGMFNVDAAGYVRIGGSIAGGHAYLIIGYSTERRAFRCLNSWGYSWGQQGRFWVTEAEMARLVYLEDGEAVTAVERLKVAAR